MVRMRKCEKALRASLDRGFRSEKALECSFQVSDPSLGGSKEVEATFLAPKKSMNSCKTA